MRLQCPVPKQIDQQPICTLVTTNNQFAAAMTTKSRIEQALESGHLVVAAGLSATVR
jgi:hypothetical protein